MAIIKLLQRPALAMLAHLPIHKHKRNFGTNVTEIIDRCCPLDQVVILFYCLIKVIPCLPTIDEY